MKADEADDERRLMSDEARSDADPPLWLWAYHTAHILARYNPSDRYSRVLFDGY